MGLLRRLLLFKLGVLFGIVVAAAFFKRVVRSRGDAESDELALVAILDGVELESRARAFRGGSMLAGSAASTSTYAAPSSRAAPASPSTRSSAGSTSRRRRAGESSPT